MNPQLWHTKFKDTLKRREKALLKPMREYYFKQYQKAVARYGHDKLPDEIAEILFNKERLRKIYRRIYQHVYPYMGMWSLKNDIDTKDVTLIDILTILKEKSDALAEVMLFQRLEMLQVTNRNAVAAVIELFRKDQEFITLGEQQAKKELLKRFMELSEYQARRVIRTESTNAANAGMIAAAKEYFPDRILYKRWISTNDSRVRKAHAIRNRRFVETGQPDTVGQLDQFFVGGELLDHPGAGKKAENNIFCRCSVALTRRKPNYG